MDIVASGDFLPDPFVTRDLISSGRLEIFLQGEWGTVCNDGFGPTEADVACRQLGFTSVEDFGSVRDFG